MGSPFSRAKVATTKDEFFPLGDFPLSSGATLADAHLSFRVLGELNSARNNLVLIPTSFGAWPEDLCWSVGPILEPQRWCVVVVSQFGNGRSSSPSHGGLPLAQGGWPVDHSDNLRAQLRLLQEVFRVETVALIYGWSMGAQQAYHWAALEPERVARICCLCGTARTTSHNRLFLLSLRQALTADPHWDGQNFTDTPVEGLRSFALIYASWAASQPFYRNQPYRQLGYASVEEYVETCWLPAYARHDPRDLIAMIDVWLANDLARSARSWNTGHQCDAPDASAVLLNNQADARRDPSSNCGDTGDDAVVADPGADPDGSPPSLEPDLAAALGRIRARSCVIAASHDLYFPPQDLAAEAAAIPGAVYRLLPSHLGHRAGNPRDSPVEQAFIRRELERLCAD